MNRWTFYLLMLACSWYILIQMRLYSAENFGTIRLFLHLESVEFALVQAVSITFPILLGDLHAAKYDEVRPSYYWMFALPFTMHCLGSMASNVAYLLGHITSPYVLAADDYEVIMMKFVLVLGFQFFALLELLIVFYFSVLRICLARSAQRRGNN